MRLIQNRESIEEYDNSCSDFFDKQDYIEDWDVLVAKEAQPIFSRNVLYNMYIEPYNIKNIKNDNPDDYYHFISVYCSNELRNHYKSAAMIIDTLNDDILREQLISGIDNPKHWIIENFANK